MCYKIVIEQSENNYAAYVPDLPGCVATGYTEQDVITEIRQAIVLHIESLIEHGEFVPRP
ncbi:MAG: type II toxin-antitoxin system HicB family antitoxin [Gemmatimonadetes bacterium]|nr:type II toxin-antitoxin system HicB family antitoxin [Gemmatimonadota bacterium]